jgi:hypothetical protein
LAINNPTASAGENKNGIVVYKENGDLADQGTVRWLGFDEDLMQINQENSQYRSVGHGTICY